MKHRNNLDEMLASINASNRGIYIFVSTQTVPDNIEPFAIIHESEGSTIIIAEDAARASGFPLNDRYARITLGVNSTLDTVGLTAAVAQAFASRSLPCNVVAGFYHDHIFVQADHVNEAVEILNDLSRQAKGWLPPSEN